MPKPGTEEDRRKAGAGQRGRTISPRGKPTFLTESKAHARRRGRRDARQGGWHELLFDVAAGRVEFVVIGWVTGPGGAWDVRGHAEAPEDRARDVGLMDGGDNPHPPVALRALLQIDGECPLEKELPIEAPGDRVEQAVEQAVPVVDGEDAGREKDWRERSPCRSRWLLLLERYGRCGGLA